MEIPLELKSLYNHWNFHTNAPVESVSVDVDQNILSEITSFITERQQIWERKILNKTPPYSTDVILNKFRFCNIYRELDKQTIEFHALLNPLRNNFEMWLLNMLFCRFICKPETIKQIGLLSFELENNKKVFEKLKSLTRPKYGTAYIFPISVIQKTQYPTREEFFCFYLQQIVSKVVNEIKTFKRIGVSEALEKILPIFGLNLKFHWTEVLIDTAYQFPEYIDLFKKFPIGPGSLPTMELLNGGKDPEETCLSLIKIHLSQFPYLEFEGKKVYLSTENWEGIGCEFRKYSNLKSGKGRRRLYN